MRPSASEWTTDPKSAMDTGQQSPARRWPFRPVLRRHNQAPARALKDRILSAPGSAIARVSCRNRKLARPAPAAAQSEMLRVSVFCRFNSPERRFYLSGGRIYFPVRSPREFPFGCFVISITCQHGLGRRTAWSRVFRSIFPSTRENPGRRLLFAELKFDTPRGPQPAGFPVSRKETIFNLAPELITSA